MNLLPLRGSLIGLLSLLATSGLLSAQDVPPAVGHRVDFATEVRPILAKACIRCHGQAKMKGGLVLDDRATALKGGDSGPAILPGKGAESRLVRYAAGVDDEFVMPPVGEGDSLSDEQVGVLRAWIDQGADWPESGAGRPGSKSDHWSFRAPTHPTVPGRDPSLNPIDAFVLARLAREGIEPAPEADRATLLRRLSLDLIGLPPTIAELDAYLSDDRTDAYERQVDRLLASPHYGERWARRWLDRARYADTNGYEKDRERSIWPYRDWVIDALNRDLPFDKFTVEQIAGDLLPDATPAQKVATGFHRNTMVNEEGGIDVEEFRFAAVVDRVATTGGVWLGLTIQCAQCHTHKFDPITQRDYYRFFALLNNADEPDLEIPTPDDVARRTAIEAEIARMEEARSVPPEAVDRWERSLRPVAWTIRTPARLVSEKHATLDLRPDGSVLARGDKPNNDVYRVDIEGDLSGVSALRLEVLPDPSLPDGGPGRAPLFSVGDFILTEFKAELVDGEKASPLAISRAIEDYAEPKHPASLALDGKTDTGWTVKGGIGRAHSAVFAFATPLPTGRKARLRLTLRQDGIHQMTIGRFRISTATAPGPVSASGLSAEVEAALTIPSWARTAYESAMIRSAYLDRASELERVNRKIAARRKAIPRPTTTLVMEERRPTEARTTRIHRRGEFLQPGEAVEPGVPGVLPPLPSAAPADRLALARWLVAPENPLTARVVVNGAWAAFFGRGIVATVDDFGTRGDAPTHPELLDWLAVEFVRLGWSQKAIHRRIVTSATYRRSSRATPAQVARDPMNVLLARGPRHRIEAETVRDIALTVSGLLNPKVGGPSVYPPQPDGVTALAYGQNAWPTSSGPDRHRRGLYTFTKRTAPYATFGLFDAPSPDTTCLRRERSNTPLQALTLLNDPVYVEASRALASRAAREAPGSAEARVRYLFRLCTARAPTSEESAAVVAFFGTQVGRFRSGDLDPKLGGPDADPIADPAERAAWTAVARALLNLDETITKE